MTSIEAHTECGEANKDDNNAEVEKKSTLVDIEKPETALERSF